MKRLKFIIFFIVFFIATLNAQIFEIEDKYINDFAKIMKETDKKSLKELLIKFNKNTNIDISIIIINSLKDYIKDDIVLEEFAKNLFNSENMKFTDRKKSILFIIALKDRKLHYESGSEITSGIISLLSDIIDNKIIPNFKNEEYSRGIYDGIREFIKKAGKKQKNKIKISMELFYITTGILILLIIIFLLFKKGKNKTKVIEEFGKGACASWE